uniref:V protein n=1 Tax=Cardioderma bat adenovirus TaxID=3141913 RepID=A0AAU7E0A7_9ADEN
MAAVSRAIKEELLEATAPEVYAAPGGKRRRGATRVKTESRVDVKSLTKKESKKRKAAAAAAAAAADELEILGATAPRRPYQWRGRRVRRVLRPGTTVVFSPGERSGVRAKRSADEVYADEDILEQLERGDGEFAYGKRARVLETSNPTPSLEPLTEQVVLPGQAKLLPTVQVLAPRKRRAAASTADSGGEGAEAKRVKAEAPFASYSEGGDSKVKVELRERKRVAPGLAVETVDVKIPVAKRKREEDVAVDVMKRLKQDPDALEETLRVAYSEIPEKIPLDPGVEPMAVEATAAAAPAGARLLPEVRLHPSMLTSSARTPRARVRPAEGVRYHPSINLVSRVVRSGLRRQRAQRRRRRARRARRGSQVPLSRLWPARYHPTITVPTRRSLL